jgi:DNA-binding MarR family transcriptional regulator
MTRTPAQQEALRQLRRVAAAARAREILAALSPADREAVFTAVRCEWVSRYDFAAGAP